MNHGVSNDNRSSLQAFSHGNNVRVVAADIATLPHFMEKLHISVNGGTKREGDRDSIFVPFQKTPIDVGSNLRPEQSHTTALSY